MKFICATLLILAALYQPPASARPGFRPYHYPQPAPVQQGWPPQYRYSYPQQVREPQPEPPRIETRISDDTPYEQQNLIYSIRIISQGNLQTAKPQPPQLDSVVFRPIGDPISTTDQQQVITEYHYLLMPLVSGRIAIPPATVSGTLRSPGNPKYSARSPDALVLDVKPAAEAIQPWLPLHDLRFNARLADFDTFEAGKPITLIVEMIAEGAFGSQLPSIASLLHSDDFKIYPGSRHSEGQLSADAGKLLGRRREEFTLVPLYGGQLRLPSPRINWWNVDAHRPEVAAFVLRHLNVAGPPRKTRIDTGGNFLPSGGSIYFWLPFAAALLFLLYGWLNAFFGSGRMPGLSALRRMFQRLLGNLYQPVATVAMRLSPRRHFHRFRSWTGRKLPISWKLWFCMRAIAREEDPGEWVQALQILAAKHLGIRAHANLQHLGRAIAACHPGADQAQVDQLMRELDRAVYGGTPIHSFRRWKHDFEHQIKPRLFALRLRRCTDARKPGKQLPELNPGSH